MHRFLKLSLHSPDFHTIADHENVFSYVGFSGVSVGDTLFDASRAPPFELEGYDVEVYAREGADAFPQRFGLEIAAIPDDVVPGAEGGPEGALRLCVDNHMFAKLMSLRGDEKVTLWVRFSAGPDTPEIKDAFQSEAHASSHYWNTQGVPLLRPAFFNLWVTPATT